MNGKRKKKLKVIDNFELIKLLRRRKDMGTSIPNRDKLLGVSIVLASSMFVLSVLVMAILSFI